MDVRFTDLKVYMPMQPNWHRRLIQVQNFGGSNPLIGTMSQLLRQSVNTDFESLNYYRLPSPTYMADNGDMWLAANALQEGEVKLSVPSRQKAVGFRQEQHLNKKSRVVLVDFPSVHK